MNTLGLFSHTGFIAAGVFHYPLYFKSEMVIDVEGDTLTRRWERRRESQLHQRISYQYLYIEHDILLVYLDIGHLDGCEEVFWQLYGNLKNQSRAVYQESCMLHLRENSGYYIASMEP